jgi:hypothetical protein
MATMPKLVATAAKFYDVFRFHLVKVISSKGPLRTATTADRYRADPHSGLSQTAASEKGIRNDASRAAYL